MQKIYTCSALLFVFITTCAGQSISLTGTSYTQNFNTLSNTAASTTNALTINGWYLTETGGGARDNELYAVDNGASNAGDTYSYGSTAATDRALGGLRSGTLISVIGASFTNNTGAALSSFTINYTGEEWRLGTASRTDQLNFEYSTNATDLATGTWTNVAALNFVTPNTATVGAKDGNAAGNFTLFTNNITGVSIPNGATFWIRWIDVDVTGADDGLAVDDFSISTGSGGPLPLTLTNFAAIKQKQTGKLSWTTEQEINSSYFIVERSADNKNWQSIAQVAAAGNSNTLLHYAFTDNDPLKGNNLYRLKMVDLDKKINYSDTRRVNFDKDYSYTVYPNPAQNFITITADKVTGAATVVQLVNASGQIVKRQQMVTGLQTSRVNVSNLKPGVYYVNITSTEGNVSLSPFVKQ